MSAEQIKKVVRRFNKHVIERGDRVAFETIMAPGFVNRSAPLGGPNDAEAMWHTFENVLRPALEALTVTIHDLLGEGDKVTTRKTISGRHVGPLLGVGATGQTIDIDVIDLVRVVDGQYAEHWGINNLSAVLAQLGQVWTPLIARDRP